MFTPIERIRKKSANLKKSIRLNRAEFGTSFGKLKSKDSVYNYYPETIPLLKKISKFHNISSNNLIVGLGAESLIKDIFLWYSMKFGKNKISFGVPNYFMYHIYVKIFNFKVKNFNIFPDQDKKINADFLINFLKKEKIKFFILVNPSHPFEKNFKLQDIKKILKFCSKKKILVLLDEVYQGLGGETSISLINKYDNLIVLRSFSKTFGMPGLRIGYLLANKKLKKEIETFRLAIELPQQSINTALMFLNNNNRLKKRKLDIIKARNFAHKEFEKRNIKSYGFKGNSVSIKLDNSNAVQKIGRYMEKKRVFINYKYPRPFEKYINITTTNKKNMNIFFKLLDNII